MGDVLRSEGQHDLDLTRTMIRVERPIENSTRACTLLDIVLRYMDALRIQGKRWFFRPVQAFYMGHTSSFRGLSKKGGNVSRGEVDFSS